MTPARIWQAIEDAKVQASLAAQLRSAQQRARLAASGGPILRTLAARAQDAAIHAGPASFTFFSGSERARVPVAANTALATAGAVGAVPGSPMPPHFLPPDSAR